MRKRPTIRIDVPGETAEEYMVSAARRFSEEFFVPTDLDVAGRVRVEAPFLGGQGVVGEAIATPAMRDDRKGVVLRVVELEPQSIKVPIPGPLAVPSVKADAPKVALPLPPPPPTPEPDPLPARAPEPAPVAAAPSTAMAAEPAPRTATPSRRERRVSAGIWAVVFANIAMVVIAILVVTSGKTSSKQLPSSIANPKQPGPAPQVDPPAPRPGSAATVERPPPPGDTSSSGSTGMVPIIKPPKLRGDEPKPATKPKPKPLDAPQSISPRQNAHVSCASFGVEIELVWSATPNATGYKLEIARDEAFTKLVSAVTVTGTVSIFRPLTPGKYFWRVSATDANGASPPSTVRGLTCAK